MIELIIAVISGMIGCRAINPKIRNYTVKKIYYIIVVLPMLLFVACDYADTIYGNGYYADDPEGWKNCINCVVNSETYIYTNTLDEPVELVYIIEDWEDGISMELTVRKTVGPGKSFTDHIRGGPSCFEPTEETSPNPVMRSNSLVMVFADGKQCDFERVYGQNDAAEHKGDIYNENAYRVTVGEHVRLLDDRWDWELNTLYEYDIDETIYALAK